MKNKMPYIATLVCPVHNEPLEKQKITQGEGADEIFLGYLFVCPRGQWGDGGKDECDYCVDTDSEGNPILDPEISIQGLFQYAGLELGKDKVADVIGRWVDERLAMRELRVVNQAQQKAFQHMNKLIALCARIAVLVDKEASLFSPKVRELIAEFNVTQADMTECMQEALKL